MPSDRGRFERRAYAIETIPYREFETGYTDETARFGRDSSPPKDEK